MECSRCIRYYFLSRLHQRKDYCSHWHSQYKKHPKLDDLEKIGLWNLSTNCHESTIVPLISFPYFLCWSLHAIHECLLEPKECNLCCRILYNVSSKIDLVVPYLVQCLLSSTNCLQLLRHLLFGNVDQQLFHLSIKLMVRLSLDLLKSFQLCLPLLLTRWWIVCRILSSWQCLNCSEKIQCSRWWPIFLYV